MPRRTTTTLLAALTGLVTLATLSSAPSDAVPPSAVSTRAVPTGVVADAPLGHGQHVLDRATRALHGATTSAGTPAASRIDATMALRDLFLARPELGDGPDGRKAKSLLARPTDGSSDPYGDGYTVPSVMRCSAHICLHWVNSTDDAPTSASWVTTTLNTMEAVWRHHINKMGYQAPPTDGTRGGNGKFDVYLKNLGSQGLYGYCAPERKVPGRPHAASGFCVLDNDFSRAEFHTKPIYALEVTAAHEFFHAIQFGYDFREDPWILESTAVWMEERFADDVNDNRMYLPYGQAAIPSAPLDIFDSAGYNQYGNWIFFEYLSEHYGNAIVRQIWQHLGNGTSGKAYSIQGVAQVLKKHGGLPAVYAAFAASNTIASKAYDEGSHFPQPPASATKKLSAKKPSWSYSTKIAHLAAKDVVLTPASSLGGSKWTLRLTINAPSAPTSPAAYVITHKKSGAFVRHPVALNQGGYGRVTINFDAAKTQLVSVTLANVSTRYACNAGTTYSCKGDPRDDNQPFVVKARARRN